jgi:hypothetical protein
MSLSPKSFNLLFILVWCIIITAIIFSVLIFAMLPIDVQYAFEFYVGFFGLILLLIIAIVAKIYTDSKKSEK